MSVAYERLTSIASGVGVRRPVLVPIMNGAIKRRKEGI